MSDFTRPTRSALIDRARSDFNSRLPGADSRLRRSWLNGMATVHGGGMDGCYGYLDGIADNTMPDTADLDHLLRWASFWGVTPKSATAGVGAAAGTGTETYVVPAGTVLQRADGFDFTTNADAAVTGGVVNIEVTASLPGTVGACDTGVVLTMVTPIAGINPAFTVSDPGITATDAEKAPELLARVELRIQNPPKGGGPGDYEGWALEVAGVTRAWEFPLWMGLGTVGVAFVFDDRDDIFPTDGDVAAMQTWLDSVAPTTAAVYPFGPTPLVTNFVLSLTPSTPATLAAAQAQLADFYIQNAEPNGTLLISQLRDAVGASAGVTDYEIVSPAANIVAAGGRLPTLGTVTEA